LPKGAVYVVELRCCSDILITLNWFLIERFFMYDTVNRNLVGGGFMSTEQKKKLLWGNKKCAAPEEVLVPSLFFLCWLVLSKYLLNTLNHFTAWLPVGYCYVWRS
jgi:hypothetical protein